ncbi:hypothetical protein DN068_21395 [Taibaiella soli]|uniref:Uncharacterized protein n=1 Tax=Taibaiella soli TaxID=1649169 RepID=A0A2W2A6D7_9BACT|nr:hypothetical protein DN068_21395 [Taibaiella soli]
MSGIRWQPVFAFRKKLFPILKIDFSFSKNATAFITVPLLPVQHYEKDISTLFYTFISLQRSIRTVQNAGPATDFDK